MRVLSADLHDAHKKICDDLRVVLDDHYRFEKTNFLSDKIFVIKLLERKPGMKSSIMTMANYSRFNKRIKESVKQSEIIRSQLQKHEVQVKSLTDKIDDIKIKISISTQTDPTESYLSNEYVNKLFRTKCSIKENLEKYVATQKKLIESRSAVLKVLDNQSNEFKSQALKVIKDMGFTLSYASVVVMSLKNNSHHPTTTSSKVLSDKQLQLMIEAAKRDKYDYNDYDNDDFDIDDSD